MRVMALIPAIPKTWKRDIQPTLLFGKQEQLTAYSFVNPSLESFANEQRVIFADQITGYITELREGRTAIWQQKPIGKGKVHAYVKDELLQNGQIGNQTLEHFLSWPCTNVRATRCHQEYCSFLLLM